MALAFAEKHEAEEPLPPAKPAKRADLNMDIDTLSGAYRQKRISLFKNIPKN